LLVYLNRPLVNPNNEPQIPRERAASYSRGDLIREKKRKIEEATEQAHAISIENYAEAFSQEAEKAAVVLAEVPIEMLNYEQNQLEIARQEKEEKDQMKYRAGLHDLNMLLDESKDLLVHKKEIMTNQLRRNEKKNIIETDKKHSQIKGAFTQAEGTLHTYLDEAKKQCVDTYRDLYLDYKDERHNLAGQKGEKDADAWRYKPQIIEINIVCLRCVKDKLPKGRYAILCSIIDRLGGNVIETKRKVSSKWRRVTAPKPHSGEYHLNNLVFNQSVLIMVPPRTKVRPSMAIQFELFMLKSRDYTHDQVLGWGVFPLTGADFELNKGKFKVFFS